MAATASLTGLLFLDNVLLALAPQSAASFQDVLRVTAALLLFALAMTGVALAGLVATALVTSRRVADRAINLSAAFATMAVFLASLWAPFAAAGAAVFNVANAVFTWIRDHIGAIIAVSLLALFGWFWSFGYATVLSALMRGYSLTIVPLYRVVPLYILLGVRWVLETGLPFLNLFALRIPSVLVTGLFFDSATCSRDTFTLLVQQLVSTGTAFAGVWISWSQTGQDVLVVAPDFVPWANSLADLVGVTQAFIACFCSSLSFVTAPAFRSLRQGNPSVPDDVSGFSAAINATINIPIVIATDIVRPIYRTVQGVEAGDEFFDILRGAQISFNGTFNTGRAVINGTLYVPDNVLQQYYILVIGEGTNNGTLVTNPGAFGGIFSCATGVLWMQLEMVKWQINLVVSIVTLEIFTYDGQLRLRPDEVIDAFLYTVRCLCALVEWAARWYRAVGDDLAGGTGVCDGTSGGDVGADIGGCIFYVIAASLDFICCLIQLFFLLWTELFRLLVYGLIGTLYTMAARIADITDTRCAVPTAADAVFYCTVPRNDDAFMFFDYLQFQLGFRRQLAGDEKPQCSRTVCNLPSCKTNADCLDSPLFGVGDRCESAYGRCLETEGSCSVGQADDFGASQFDCFKGTGGGTCTLGECQVDDDDDTPDCGIDPATPSFMCACDCAPNEWRNYLNLIVALVDCLGRWFTDAFGPGSQFIRCFLSSLTTLVTEFIMFAIDIVGQIPIILTDPTNIALSGNEFLRAFEGLCNCLADAFITFSTEVEGTPISSTVKAFEAVSLFLRCLCRSVSSIVTGFVELILALVIAARTGSSVNENDALAALKLMTAALFEFSGSLVYLVASLFYTIDLESGGDGIKTIADILCDHAAVIVDALIDVLDVVIDCLVGIFLVLPALFVCSAFDPLGYSSYGACYAELVFDPLLSCFGRLISELAAFFEVLLGPVWEIIKCSVQAITCFFNSPIEPPICDDFSVIAPSVCDDPSDVAACCEAISFPCLIEELFCIIGFPIELGCSTVCSDPGFLCNLSEAFCGLDIFLLGFAKGIDVFLNLLVDAYNAISTIVCSLNPDCTSPDLLDPANVAGNFPYIMDEIPVPRPCCVTEQGAYDFFLECFDSRFVKVEYRSQNRLCVFADADGIGTSFQFACWAHLSMEEVLAINDDAYDECCGGTNPNRACECPNPPQLCFGPTPAPSPAPPPTPMPTQGLLNCSTCAQCGSFGCVGQPVCRLDDFNNCVCNTDVCPDYYAGPFDYYQAPPAIIVEDSACPYGCAATDCTAIAEYTACQDEFGCQWYGDYGFCSTCDVDLCPLKQTGRHGKRTVGELFRAIRLEYGDGSVPRFAAYCMSVVEASAAVSPMHLWPPYDPLVHQPDGITLAQATCLSYLDSYTEAHGIQLRMQNHGAGLNSTEATLHRRQVNVFARVLTRLDNTASFWPVRAAVAFPINTLRLFLRLGNADQGVMVAGDGMLGTASVQLDPVHCNRDNMVPAVLVDLVRPSFGRIFNAAVQSVQRVKLDLQTMGGREALLQDAKYAKTRSAAVLANVTRQITLAFHQHNVAGAIGQAVHRLATVGAHIAKRSADRAMAVPGAVPAVSASLLAPRTPQAALWRQHVAQRFLGAPPAETQALMPTAQEKRQILGLQPSSMEAWYDNVVGRLNDKGTRLLRQALWQTDDLAEIQMRRRKRANDNDDDPCDLRASPWQCCPEQALCTNCSVLDRAFWAAQDGFTQNIRYFENEYVTRFTSCVTAAGDSINYMIVPPAQACPADSKCQLPECETDRDCQQSALGEDTTGNGTALVCDEFLGRCVLSLAACQAGPPGFVEGRACYAVVGMTDAAAIGTCNSVTAECEGPFSSDFPLDCRCPDTFLTVNKTVPWLFDRLPTLPVPCQLNITCVRAAILPPGTNLTVPDDQPYRGTFVAAKTANGTASNFDVSLLAAIDAISAGTGTAIITAIEDAVYVVAQASDTDALTRFANEFLFCDYEDDWFCPLEADSPPAPGCCSDRCEQRKQGVGLFAGIVWALLVLLVPLALCSLCGPLVACNGFVTAIWLLLAVSLTLALANGGGLLCYTPGPLLLVLPFYAGIVSLVLLVFRILCCGAPGAAFVAVLAVVFRIIGMILLVASFLPGLTTCTGMDVYNIGSELVPPCFPVPPVLIDRSQPGALAPCGSFLDTGVNVTLPAVIDCTTTPLLGQTRFRDGLDNLFYIIEAVAPDTNADLAARLASGPFASLAEYAEAHTSEAQATGQPYTDACFWITSPSLFVAVFVLLAQITLAAVLLAATVAVLGLLLLPCLLSGRTWYVLLGQSYDALYGPAEDTPGPPATDTSKVKKE